MKEVQVKTEITNTYYEAIDGKRFVSKSECELYENTARAVINSNFKKLVVKEANQWDFMGGDEDHTVYVVKMKSQDDVNTVKQRFFLDNLHLLKEGYAKQLADIEGNIERAFNEDDYLLLGVNYDGYMYMLNTAKYYINNLVNIDK